MSIPVSAIISLVGAFMKNKTGHPVKRATVGAIKAPITAPLALATQVSEKPLQSAGIATLGAIAGSYMQEEQGLNTYEFVLELTDKLIDFASTFIS